MLHRTCRGSLLVLLLSSATLCASAADAGRVPMTAQIVPTPRAQALPVRPLNRPFLAANRTGQPVDLAAVGYTESEYLVKGFANIYEWFGEPTDAAVAIRDRAVPYVTRMLVRRPASAAKASGLVVVELLNPTGLYDFAPLWGFSWQHFTRRGDVWVGITVKPVAGQTLRTFDPVRYADVSFAFQQSPDCQAVAPRAGMPGAGDPRVNAPDAENGLAWDITAQIGALLQSSSKENPVLDIAPPRRIVAAGYSQTGGYLVTFANALHRRLRLGDGRPVFDGYLNAAGANPAPINQCAGELPEGDPRRVVLPRDVPFVTAMTESDFNRQPALRRADSDEPGDLFRRYEIAGAGHAGPFAAGVPSAEDLAIAGFAPPAEGLCREERGDFPVALAFNAIWQQYSDWLTAGLPFEHEAPIETDADHQVVRDANGNARGGWRLPQIDAPLASYNGRGTPRDDSDRARAACALTGVKTPWSAERLKEIYRSRADFSAQFEQAVDLAVSGRRVTPEDGAALKNPSRREIPAF